MYKNWKLKKFKSGAVYLINKDRQKTASDQLFLGMEKEKEEETEYDVIIKIKKKR